MKYDFETMLNRYNTGSLKWEEMGKYGITQDMNIIPMSNAEMEFYNPPEVVKGLCDYINKTVMAYFYPMDSYYEALINWMKNRHSWRVERDWVIPYPGVHGVLCSILNAFTEKGDGVIVMPPTWPGFFAVIKDNNRVQINNPLIYDDNTYYIDFEDLEKKASDPNNKVLFFCSPQNPVGRVWTREELIRVAEICIDHNVLIISDEVHSDIIMPGFKHIPLASISSCISDHTITCTAPSKTFNLAGLFTSNIITSNSEYKEKIKKICSKQGVFRPNMLGVKACELAYAKGGAWLDKCVDKINENREYVKNFIEEKLPMLKLTDCQGGYLLWVDMNDLGLDTYEMEKKLMEEAHIFFDDGYYFGDEGKGFERINIACPTEAVKDAMNRLYKWVGKLEKSEKSKSCNKIFLAAK